MLLVMLYPLAVQVPIGCINSLQSDTKIIADPIPGANTATATATSAAVVVVVVVVVVVCCLLSVVCCLLSVVPHTISAH